MQIIPPLEQGIFYHIYSRGTNSETIFREQRNYDYFLDKWKFYIPSVADTFAYSLLANHFHALIKVKTGELMHKNKSGIEYPAVPDRQFSHLLNGYSQGFNKTYHRTGSLFEHPFKRESIDNKKQLINTLAYILFNPQKHEFAVNFRHYPFSSFQLMMSSTDSFIQKEKVFEWFGGEEKFIEYMDSYEQRFKFKYFRKINSKSMKNRGLSL
jgi:hypothetical protein